MQSVLNSIWRRGWKINASPTERKIPHPMRPGTTQQIRRIKRYCRIGVVLDSSASADANPALFAPLFAMFLPQSGPRLQGLHSTQCG
eukprot:scaffold12205_cov33-Tisochrysis_lutea.AAC.1